MVRFVLLALGLQQGLWSVPRGDARLIHLERNDVRGGGHHPPCMGGDLLVDPSGRAGSSRCFELVRGEVLSNITTNLPLILRYSCTYQVQHTQISDMYSLLLTTMPICGTLKRFHMKTKCTSSKNRPALLSDTTSAALSRMCDHSAQSYA